MAIYKCIQSFTGTKTNRLSSVMRADNFTIVNVCFAGDNRIYFVLHYRAVPSIVYIHVIIYICRTNAFQFYGNAIYRIYIPLGFP